MLQSTVCLIPDAGDRRFVRQVAVNPAFGGKMVSIPSGSVVVGNFDGQRSVWVSQGISNSLELKRELNRLRLTTVKVDSGAMECRHGALHYSLAGTDNMPPLTFKIRKLKGEETLTIWSLPGCVLSGSMDNGARILHGRVTLGKSQCLLRLR